MFAVGGAVGVLLGILGLVFATAGIALGIFLVRQVRLRGRAGKEGLTAEARCLETYVTDDRSAGSGHVHSTRHVILGFRTHDGREIRIRDTSGVPRVVGDHVQVRYLPEHPEGAAPVSPMSPAVSIGLVLGLLFCTGLTFAGLFFALVGFGIGYVGFNIPADPSTMFPNPTSMP